MITFRNCLASKSGSNHFGERILTINSGTSVSSMALYALLFSMIVLTRLTVLRLVVLMISLFNTTPAVFLGSSDKYQSCAVYVFLVEGF